MRPSASSLVGQINFLTISVPSSVSHNCLKEDVNCFDIESSFSLLTWPLLAGAPVVVDCDRQEREGLGNVDKLMCMWRERKTERRKRNRWTEREKVQLHR